jgi:geranylgeranyl diphosphate synthase type II
MAFLDQLDRYREPVETALKIYLKDPLIPGSLADAMAYSLLNGGKRLRPCMTLAASELVGGDARAALPVACAIEMIHTYSLIHDDLPCMDNDDYRRGKPSNHIVFGENKAVLAGDGLLSYAFQAMLRAQFDWIKTVPDYPEAISAVAEGAGVFGMVAGQVRDLECENCAEADEKDLLYIHAHKTGAMLKASILAGAYMKHPGKDAICALIRFGEAFGLLFQITDDILDAEGENHKLGKTAGKDAASGKLTFVTLHGLEKARYEARKAADDAKNSLLRFGDRSDFFAGLVDFTLNREA